MDTVCEHCGKTTRVVVAGPTASDHSLRLDLNVTETAISERRVIILDMNALPAAEPIIATCVYVLEKPDKCMARVMSDGSVCCDQCLKYLPYTGERELNCERYP